MSPEANAARLESRSLADPGLKKFLEQNLPRKLREWPATSWDFEMLTLAALYFQPALEVARTQVAVAEGGKITAAQRPNPTLNVTPAYNFTTITPSPWLPLGTIDVPIETAGKRRYRREQAGHLSEAARFAVMASAWQTRSELRAALFDFSAAGQREAFLRSQVALHEQILEKLEQQVRAGAVAASATLSLRVALVKARLDLADNQRQRVDARARVAAALGLPVAALDRVTLVYDMRTDETLAGQLSSAEIRRLALTSRADILGALADYAASESALQLEIARQYPNLKISPGYEYDQGDSKWSLGLSVDLPVLNRNEGPIAEAKARRSESAARFNLLQAKVLSEIDRSVEALKIASTNSSILQSMAGEQRRKRDAVAGQLKAGAAEPVELLSAELELTATEMSRFEGELKFRQALGTLEDAVQRPFEIPPTVLTQGGSHAF